MAAVAAGADALGVNFHAGSPRCCSPAMARAIVARVGELALVYGLFVDRSRSAIAETVRETGVGGIQLHGDEPAELSLGWDLPVLRAIRVRSRSEVADALLGARGYRLLLDSPLGGGSGRGFDESLVEGLDLSQSVVAGGLTPANVGARVRRLSPWGVDVSSGVESAPGIKDATKMEEFVRNAKSAR